MTMVDDILKQVEIDVTKQLVCSHGIVLVKKRKASRLPPNDVPNRIRVCLGLSEGYYMEYEVGCLGEAPEELGDDFNVSNVITQSDKAFKELLRYFDGLDTKFNYSNFPETYKALSGEGEEP